MHEKKNVKYGNILVYINLIKHFKKIQIFMRNKKIQFFWFSLWSAVFVKIIKLLAMKLKFFFRNS